MLNLTSGGERDGVSLRPVSGFDASDYFVGGYWVWAKIVESLAHIGGLNF